MNVSGRRSVRCHLLPAAASRRYASIGPIRSTRLRLIAVRANACNRILALCVFWLCALTACGFQPLYQQSSLRSPAATAPTPEILVANIPDRPGQQLHTLLIDGLNPHGIEGTADYVLEVTLEEEVEETALQKDETATRANVTLRALFTLRELDTGEPLLSGASLSTTSYNILDSPFATDVGEQNARERGLRELASDIQTRLAVFFARPRSASAS